MKRFLMKIPPVQTVVFLFSEQGEIEPSHFLVDGLVILVLAFFVVRFGAKYFLYN
jgi:hypothetical protein